jgi:hypothetical protein
MSLKVPFAGSLKLLTAIITSSLSTAILRSYSNNHVPADGDVAATYTENTYPGYAGIALNAWSIPALDGSNKASTNMPSQVWTGGAIITPQNIYGVYVTDAGGNLLYAELNPAGVVSMAVAGQTYAYTPVFTLKSEF